MTFLITGGVVLILILVAYLVNYWHVRKDGTLYVSSTWLHESAKDRR